jgi:hypothetical protein
MVARAVPTQRDVPVVSQGITVRLFTAWRVLLTRLGHGIALGAERAWFFLRRAAASTVALSGKAVRGTTRATREGVGELGDSLGWLFKGWRRVVTKTVSVARPSERLASARMLLSDALMVLRCPTTFGSLDAPRADRLAALGFRTFVLGSMGGVILGWLTAGSPGSALAAAVNSALWAGARLAVLIALAPQGRRMRLVTFTAWGVSLLPYLLGVTDGLRLVALAGSAFVCFGALRGAGLRAGTTRTMTVWAFGGQAGVSVLGWLLRGGLAVLVGL